jgi:phosphate transport system permease protein
MIAPIHLKEFMESQFLWRRVKNVFAGVFFLGCALGVLMLLGSIFGYLVFKGSAGINWSFFTSLPLPVGEVGGGMLNSLLGSFLLVLFASFLGIPWGILAGVYLSEYGKNKHFIRFSVDMLASVPSIVLGLFVYVILVRPLGGFSLFAGGVALAFIMVPTVARTTEELLKMVPEYVREAGLALGIPRWKVILHIVLKGSLPGITTGVMLAVARVSGETAPLLFTALNNRFLSFHFLRPISSLPVQIYTYAISPFPDWNRQAWTAALILVLFVFGLNLLVRLSLRRGVR